MLDILFPPEISGYIMTAFRIVWESAWIWLPILTGFGLFNKWVDYRRTVYWQGMGSMLLEIKLPKDVYKSPAAMEVVLGTLHQTADEGNWYWKYWRGQTRTWFSLEIVSLGGQVHFYIWSRVKYKNSIEAHLYSQYPGVEVYEVEDYAKELYYDDDRLKLFGCQWELSKPDPYPIKTYVDYGLHQDPKEELKVDPMTSMIEFLGTVPPGHKVIFQFIIRAHKKEQKKKGSWFDKTDAWIDEAMAEKQKILDKMKEDGRSVPTEGEKETMSALDRSISKYPFDVGIRSIYIAEKDKYNGSYLGGMLGALKQFGSPGSNGFKSTGWSAKVSYPWHEWPMFYPKDFIGPRIIDEYKKRSFFFSSHLGKSYYSKPFVLNAEELATIFHLPGQVVTTPTVDRIASKKSEAPSNLPI